MAAACLSARPCCWRRRRRSGRFSSKKETKRGARRNEARVIFSKNAGFTSVFGGWKTFLKAKTIKRNAPLFVYPNRVSRWTVSLKRVQIIRCRKINMIVPCRPGQNYPSCLKTRGAFGDPPHPTGSLTLFRRLKERRRVWHPRCKPLLHGRIAITTLRIWRGLS